MRWFLLLSVFFVFIFSGCAPAGTLTPTIVSTASTAAPPSDTAAPLTDTPVASTDTPAPTATAAPGSSSGFPNPANYQWTEFAASLTAPVDIQNAGDDSGRLFIVEKTGRIRVIKNGQLLETPFLDITDRVNSGSSECGLLGLAFHPKYKENGYFYVNYTGAGGDTFISRFQVTGDPDIADPASEKRLLTVKQPYPNHNGGATTFGPDGYLYLGLGDGGSGGDPLGNGQNTGVLLGKILRIDVDHGDPYSIPADNPFGNEVWAHGLRNPWRISFDKGTGDLWIADVGQNSWEEIDYAPRGTPGGANYGWNIMEGDHPYNGQPGPDLIPPVAEYSHSLGCSVTGGYVYRGSMPEWQGIYLYGDYCSGTIWGLVKSGDGWQNQVLFETNFNISSFGVDESGELYLASLGGTIYKLTAK